MILGDPFRQEKNKKYLSIPKPSILLSMISPPKYFAYTRLSGRPTPNPASGSVDPKSAVTMIHTYTCVWVYKQQEKVKVVKSHFHPHDQGGKSRHLLRACENIQYEGKYIVLTYSSSNWFSVNAFFFSFPVLLSQDSTHEKKKGGVFGCTTVTRIFFTCGGDSFAC